MCVIGSSFRVTFTPLLLFAAVASSIACAGPMSPFGAINALPTVDQAAPFSEAALESHKGAISQSSLSGGLPQLSFLPKRQVLHGRSPFSIVIEDPDGVPEDFRIWVFHDGIDVSDAFLQRATQTFSDPSRRKLSLSTRALRVLPDRDNKIIIAYRRSPDHLAVIAHYLQPICTSDTVGLPLIAAPGFRTTKRLMAIINQYAEEKSFNPFFIAGLIAQESSFDPHVVSFNKAIGLTQVTALAEAEVIKKYPDWPRNSKITDLPLPLVKLSILNGEINARNEWRLDPALSVAGGVEYLAYLVDYWNKPEKRLLLERYVGRETQTLSDVLLASYNSGAARVSQAIEVHGAHWLRAGDLIEARKYVRRAVSYCDHFSQQHSKLGGEIK